jgi:hypothetical protein
MDSELTALKAEVEQLKSTVKDREKRIADASILLYDWDGFYDPVKNRGNPVELARLVEDAYIVLQGKSWRRQAAT